MWLKFVHHLITHRATFVSYYGPSLGATVLLMSFSLAWFHKSSVVIVDKIMSLLDVLPFCGLGSVSKSVS